MSVASFIGASGLATRVYRIGSRSACGATATPKTQGTCPGVPTFLQNLLTERELESNLDLRTTRPSAVAVRSLTHIPPPTAQFPSSGSPQIPIKVTRDCNFTPSLGSSLITIRSIGGLPSCTSSPSSIPLS